MFCFSIGFILFVPLVSAQINKYRIMNSLERGLTYLENVKELDINATFNIVVADGEVIYSVETAETITEEEKTKLEKIRNRLEVFINHLKETQPNEYPVANLFYPEDWLSDGDYRFKKNRVSGPASTKSITEIYGNNNGDDKCDDELYANKKTDQPRSCGISSDCIHKMTNTEDEGSIACIQRINFLSSLRFLKCTENPQNSFEIVTKLCNVMYKRVLKLADAGFNQKKASYFMDEVLICGTYGFPEFYSDSILKLLTNEQNMDGSIGKENVKVKKVLTAQYVAIMASAFRLKLAGTV